MKILRLVIRSILVASITIALPLALLGRNVGQFIFSSTRVLKFLETHVFDSQALANATVQTIRQQTLNTGEPANPGTALAQVILLDIDQEQWAELYELLFPKELLSKAAEPTLEGAYNWLDNSDTYPTIQLDIRFLINNLKANGEPLVSWLLARMPPCTFEQIGEMASLEASNDVLEYLAQVPMCNPSEGRYAQVPFNVANYLSDGLDTLPNEIDITESIVPAFAPQEMLAIKRQLRIFRSALDLSWIAVLLLLMFLIPFKARSARQVIPWAAWPMLLAGGILAAITIGLPNILDRMLVDAISKLSFDLPQPFLQLTQNAFSALVNQIIHPLIPDAILLIAVGGGVLLIMLLMEIFEKAWGKKRPEIKAAQHSAYSNWLGIMLVLLAFIGLLTRQYARESASSKTPVNTIATAQALATSTVNAQSTAAAHTQEAEAARARITATAQVRLAITAEARDSLIRGFLARGKLIYGPSSGSLMHKEDNSISIANASVQCKNFVTEVRFFNPFPVAWGTWDYGILFRDEHGNQQYRLTIQADKSWKVTNNTESDYEVIAKGNVSNLVTANNASNLILLIVENERGWLYVNNVFVAEFDLSSRTNPGDVSIGTGITRGAEIEGEETRYEDFQVWSLP